MKFLGIAIICNVKFFNFPSFINGNCNFYFKYTYSLISYLILANLLLLIYHFSKILILTFFESSIKFYMTLIFII
jgi:hypothetical protein